MLCLCITKRWSLCTGVYSLNFMQQTIGSRRSKPRQCYVSWLLTNNCNILIGRIVLRQRFRLLGTSVMLKKFIIVLVSLSKNQTSIKKVYVKRLQANLVDFFFNDYAKLFSKKILVIFFITTVPVPRQNISVNRIAAIYHRALFRRK